MQGLLFRAALLAGEGARAAPWAQRMASAVGEAPARSCLDAGAPVQLTLDAPGRVRLRAGVALGERDLPQRLAMLLPPALADRLSTAAAAMPAPAHAGLGHWLYASGDGPSLYLDLRDPQPVDAMSRLLAVLSAAQQARLRALRPRLGEVRPWVLQWQAGPGHATLRPLVHWLLPRGMPAQALLERLAPGAWPQVTALLGLLLRRPQASGRWVVATPLDDGEDLRVGNSGWALVPEDEAKHRAVGALMAALGGPRDHAEAMWSLCQGGSTPGHRVGRACELKLIGHEVVRARLFLAPAGQARPPGADTLAGLPT